MNKVGKYVAIGGAVYATGSVVRLICVAPVIFGVLAAILLFLFALTGTPGDDLIRYGLIILAWIVIIQLIKLAVEGHAGLAFVIGFALFCLADITQPTVSSFLAQWDTPERRFNAKMDHACTQLWNGFKYDYSPKDGYCHFDHYHYDRNRDASDVELKVPPIENALENIERLKQKRVAR
jgi:hypothetical protein